MNAMRSVGRHVLVATVLAALLGAAPSDAAADTTRGAVPRDVLQAKLRDIQGEIEWLAEAGRSDRAAQFREELDRIKERLDGRYPATESEKPELHVVGVSQGSAAPAGVLKGPARFSTGYAEVHVTHTARPIVLALAGGDPLHWQVKAEPGVRFLAVILSGKIPRTVCGVPEGTLIFGQTEYDSPERVVDPVSGSTLPDKTLEHFTGLPVATNLHQSRYGGRSITLGPENEAWRWQHNMAALDDLRERAAQLRRDEVRKSVAGLRFSGIYYTHGPAGPTAAVGDYTPFGPVAGTLKPLHHELRLAITDEPSETTFALNNHWKLVVVEPSAEELLPVPLMADMPTGWRFDAMALDTKRHRLVLARQEGQPPLFAYDLETAQWLNLAKAPSRLRSLAYSAEEDVLHGLAESGGFPHAPRTDHIVKFGPDGGLLGKIPLSEAINIGDFGVGTVQLICVEGKIVVLVPPCNRNPHMPAPADGPYGWSDGPPGRVYVVDPASGHVMYFGIQQPHDGRGNVLVDVESAPGRPPAGGLLAELWKKLATAEDWIDTLRASSDAERARRAAETLDLLKARLQGEYPTQEDAPAELHYVGFYSKGSPVIEVTDRSRPVVLALASYEPVHWTVKAAPGVKLKKVLLGGYHHQYVNQAPDGVPVEIHTSEGREGEPFYAYSKDPEAYPRLVEQLRKLTGLKIATFYGSYTPPQGAIVVGPENVRWRVEDVVFGLDCLFQESQRQEKERLLKRLDKLTFHALRYSIPQQAAGGPPRGFPHEQGDAAWGQFTVRGPIASTLKPIPRNVHRLAVDPQGSAFYGREGGDVFQFDPESGQRSDIPVTDVPRFSWPSDIAFDTERRRLLLSSFGGGGYLYACYVDNGQWKVLRRPGLGGGPFCYAPENDVLYSLNPVHRGYASLVTLNAEGAAVHQVKVPKSFGSHAPDLRLQLCCADGYVIVLGPMAADPDNPAERRDRVTVIDPKTGDVIYEGLSRPSAD